jgi:S1-C subfamily serine protease
MKLVAIDFETADNGRDSAGKQVAAELVDTDKRNDLALLKISSTKTASADTKSLIRKLGVRIASRGVPLSSDGLLRSEDVELGDPSSLTSYYALRRSVQSWEPTSL